MGSPPKTSRTASMAAIRHMMCPFVSDVPRPKSLPSDSVTSKGGTFHSSSGSGG
jgi:hypothetical protein